MSCLPKHSLRAMRLAAPPSRRAIFGRLASLGALCGLLAACAPAFNWREVRPGDPAVAVMLPGKPASLTQRVLLDGFDLPMSMTGAKVEGVAFTVACAVLPDAQADTRERVLAAMRSGMVRNLAGTEEAAEKIEVGLIDAAGERRGLAPAWRVRVAGSIQSRPARMLAVFVGEGRRACQAVALGESLPDDEARQFADSLRLIVAAG
jgi:hypothetical protein